MIICNDGTCVTQVGNVINVSNGESYTFMGSMLSGSHGYSSMNVKSISEAVGIVVGLHGGRRF